MKKSVLVFGLLGLLPVMSVTAHEYSGGESDYYVARQTQKHSYKKASGSKNVITNNIYYNQYQPQAVSYDYAPEHRKRNYKNVYEDMNTSYEFSHTNYSDDARDTKRQYREVKEVRKSYSSEERKFFLAHPFFQPTEGRVGSVTEMSYAHTDFKFDMLNVSVLDFDKSSATFGTVIGSGDVDFSGKAEITQFSVKEDVSFGVSDTLAILGMIQYDSTKVSFKDWSDGSPSDSESDSGINVFGIGLQNRFVDNDKWIATIAGSFQHQRDTANTFIGELKAGYKINRTTIYGLGRLGYSDLTDGDIYGAYVKAHDGDWMILSYKTDVKDIIYAEGGFGMFAVLNKYVTLNGEMVYGHYDWHNQLNIKGAIGVQPDDMFALNLYASAAIYDSAKDSVHEYIHYDNNPVNYPNTTLVEESGDYKIKDYNEWKIGVQAILYF